MNEPNPLSFKDRFQAAKTAFVSIPSTLKRGGEEGIIAQVRKYFPHLRVGAYQGEFDGDKDWRENFASYISDVDCLIVACDSSRLIGPGVLREIKAANKARKMIILFKVDDNQHRMYFGVVKEGTEEAPVIRLKKREDRFKPKGVEANADHRSSARSDLRPGAPTS
jgi:hypothetical protein